MTEVMIATPSHDGTQTLRGRTALFLGIADAYQHGIACDVPYVENSLLAHGFNFLWCAALNSYAQRGSPHYFLLMHADVAPEQGNWLRIMVDEAKRLQADVLSAMIAMKGPEGITSTAIGLKGDRWGPRHRFSLDQIHSLPETIGQADVEEIAGDDKILLVNSGLMLVDLRKPWTREVWFEISNKVTADENGLLGPQVLPEDWRFSYDAHDRGAKVYATRKVTVAHRGSHDYTSSRVWGTGEQTNVRVMTIGGDNGDARGTRGAAQADRAEDGQDTVALDAAERP